MSEQDTLQAIHVLVGKLPVPHGETHLPLDLRLQRMQLPTPHQQPTYIWDKEQDELVALNLSGLNLDDSHLDILNQEYVKPLKALNLSENSFSQISIPGTLEELIYLDLSENKQLEALSFDASLPNLKRLEINDCVLKEVEIPAGFDALEFLYAINNKVLTDIRFLGELKSLKYLYLSACGLQELEFNYPASQLAYLFANDNQLEGIKCNNGVSLVGLKRLSYEIIS